MWQKTKKPRLLNTIAYVRPCLLPYAPLQREPWGPTSVPSSEKRDINSPTVQRGPFSGCNELRNLRDRFLQIIMDCITLDMQTSNYGLCALQLQLQESAVAELPSIYRAQLERGRILAGYSCRPLGTTAEHKEKWSGSDRMRAKS